jgi:hypothetical protein
VREWILVTVIAKGSKVIGQVHEMAMVSTGDGRSVLRVQLASPFVCPETTEASGFVVPCGQPPVSAHGLVFSVEDVHMCELHATAERDGAYRFTPLK